MLLFYAFGIISFILLFLHVLFLYRRKKKLPVKQVDHDNSATTSRVSSVLYLCTAVVSTVPDLISYYSSGLRDALLISPTRDQRGMVVLETELEAVRMTYVGEQ